MGHADGTGYISCMAWTASCWTQAQHGGRVADGCARREANRLVRSLLGQVDLVHIGGSGGIRHAYAVFEAESVGGVRKKTHAAVQPRAPALVAVGRGWIKGARAGWDQ